MDGEWLEGETARLLAEKFPLRGFAQRWGDEIYFDAAVTVPAADLTEEVGVGDIAYWPPGRAVCLFFGRTPASTDDRPRPASGVAKVGRLIGDYSSLRKIAAGSGIALRAVEF